MVLNKNSLEQQEAASLSLNTEVLVLNSDNKDADINDVKGIVADASTIMQRLNTELAVETGTITLAKNVEVEESALGINSKTDIAKKTTVRKVKVTGVPGAALVPDAGIQYGISVDKMGAGGLVESGGQQSPPPANQKTSDNEPDVISAYWDSYVARRGATLKLRGTTANHSDGTPASFKIYELDQLDAESFVTEIMGEVEKNSPGVKVGLRLPERCHPAPR